MTFLCPLPVLLTERLSLMRPLCPLPLPLLLLTPWRVRLPHDTSVAPGLLVLVLFIALCGLAAAPFPLLVCEARVGAQCCYLCTRLFPAFFFLGNISPIDAYFLFSPFLTRVNNMQICRDSTTITTITTRRGTNCLCRCGRDCPCQSLKLPADSCTSERVYRFFFFYFHYRLLGFPHAAFHRLLLDLMQWLAKASASLLLHMRERERGTEGQDELKWVSEWVS